MSFVLTKITQLLIRSYSLLTINILGHTERIRSNQELRDSYQNVNVYCALEVGFQFKVLHDSILNIEPRAVEIYRSQQGNRKDESSDVEGLIEDPLFHKCVRECLKENILHHIQIVRYFNLFQNVTSPILGVSIGVSMIFLASLSLVLTKIQIFSFDAVKFTFFFFLELCFAFGYCFMGTSLTEASKQIPNALYNCPWFKLLRNEEKKILLIFEMNTENSLVLKGNGLFVIDLQLFVQIARTTYSIFNIFSSREK
ncbi:uncharacterized protein LOC120353188 [Nilaparvata lugens]|uniref:uncharacterized protein LOC120353188 n=1 Tax=Nilaparvata lugens TaxID=108931 RepID=UPI00193D4DCE|nr:uncharacterized protein LOC120353188 [Nilaparvata lugens]